MNKLHKCIGLLFFLIVCFASAAFAGEVGHYSPAPMAVRDFAMPREPMKAFINYNTYYTTDEFRNSSGTKINSISVTGSRTINVSVGNQSLPIDITGTANINLDLDIDVFIQGLGMVVVTDHEFLGGRYGFQVLPMWGKTNVDVEIGADASGTASIGGISRPFTASTLAKVEDDKTGFADLFVQPFWLGWHDTHYDAGVSWSAYLPTGAYDEDDIANVGYGFFTSQTQASFYYYPIEDMLTALMFATTWELHSKKIDKDVTPGQNITIEYGIGRYLSERLEIGVHGYNQWQVTEDKGRAAVNKDVKDSINGAGGQLSWWAVKDKCVLVCKYMQEYGAKDRLQGQYGEFNLTWIF
jgi:hypothetical protein